MPFEANDEGLYFAARLSTDEIREVLSGQHPEKTFIFPSDVKGDVPKKWRRLHALAIEREERAGSKGAKPKSPLEIKYQGEKEEIKLKRLELRQMELETKQEIGTKTTSLLIEIREVLLKILAVQQEISQRLKG